jgi:hypothetical protein
MPRLTVNGGTLTLLKVCYMPDPSRKHLYLDLQPYTCFYASCSYSSTPFMDRQLWSNHLELDHKLGPHWESITCPLCSEVTEPGKSRILIHFARHMEDIALAALPREVESEDESGSDADRRSETTSNPASDLVAMTPDGDIDQYTGTDSYWSVAEQRSFRELMGQHGMDWTAIAEKMPTKTSEMIQAQYQRDIENGDSELERLAQSAAMVDDSGHAKPRDGTHTSLAEPPDAILVRPQDTPIDEAPLVPFGHLELTEREKRKLQEQKTYFKQMELDAGTSVIHDAFDEDSERRNVADHNSQNVVPATELQAHQSNQARPDYVTVSDGRIMSTGLDGRGLADNIQMEHSLQSEQQRKDELIHFAKGGGFAGSDRKVQRRGRAAPPGRCLSCNRAETPEWRRGPDGARTLCNACGLHHAKLTHKMGGKAIASSNQTTVPQYTQAQVDQYYGQYQRYPPQPYNIIPDLQPRSIDYGLGVPEDDQAKAASAEMLPSTVQTWDPKHDSLLEERQRTAREVTTQDRQMDSKDRAEPPPHAFDYTGQIIPPGMRPRVTAALWEDQGTLCFQVEANNKCVARREDNHMINGTRLLDVAGMTRGRRDGILKSEKTRHVVKIGPMHLKGVWIPFERALEFANKERITEQLYPLFVHDIGALLYHPSNRTPSNLQQGGIPSTSDSNSSVPGHGLHTNPYLWSSGSDGRVLANNIEKQHSFKSEHQLGGHQIHQHSLNNDRDVLSRFHLLQQRDKQLSSEFGPKEDYKSESKVFHASDQYSIPLSLGTNNQSTIGQHLPEEASQRFRPFNPRERSLIERIREDQAQQQAAMQREEYARKEERDRDIQMRDQQMRENLIRRDMRGQLPPGSGPRDDRSLTERIREDQAQQRAAMQQGKLTDMGPFQPGPDDILDTICQHCAIPFYQCIHGVVSLIQLLIVICLLTNLRRHKHLTMMPAFSRPSHDPPSWLERSTMSHRAGHTNPAHQPDPTLQLHIPVFLTLRTERQTCRTSTRPW